MALVPPTFAGLILTSTAFVGPQAPQLANGIATGFTTYLVAHPANIITTLGDVGTPGTGVGNGVLIPASCAPPVLYGLLEANMKGAGLFGPSSTQLAVGLAAATCTYLASAQTLTAHAGVGTGAGVANIVGVEPVGMASAITAVTGFVGPAWPLLVGSISTALVTFLTIYVKFAVVITGPSASGVATGVGNGRIL